MKNLVMISLVTAVLAMGGCAQQHTAATAGNAGGAYGTGSGTAGGYGTGGYGTGNAGTGGYGSGGYGAGSGTYTPAELNNPNSILAQRIIYFDFDSSTIRPEFLNVLNAHAALLAAYPNLRIRLEGHADERGSREYNVALSERRGYAVLDYLQLKSVRVNQMDVIGYGEEVPAVFGANEAAWSKNRRVEIKYPGE